MGRWTPLILMAGGLAILLGTLLGINFPMGGQSASVPTNSKTSKVLPANINVNSTEAGRNNDSTNENRSNVAQNNNSTGDSTTDTENTDTTTDTQSTDTQSTEENSTSQPIRALW
ncbi:hypothetical protein H6G33_03090 [Calothrix sp. FACHB-1219]|uniref:hypothetical protein n=1 Tax=unclassified Calothrix TaxID=2619626 RepID=UPI001681C3CD|nr:MULTISPECIES: hypothetical protein [unclassified Calothrix]MBD2202892.1 hypothetical protein [Calothrix sp. FACHB-168]MBD2216020.1 hypothetical protein [Calothrix sp. FACHB-1219]